MADKEVTISAQAKAEADVRAFASQLGPFVVAANTTRMPMIFTNAKSVQNEIVYLNDSFCHLTNFERDDIVSRPFADLFAKEERSKRLSLNEISKMSNPVLRCLRKSGDEFNATVFVSPVHDSNGALDQYIVSFVDITDAEERAVELKLLESQLVQLSRVNAMGTMAATLAHELNQPLEAISNYAAGCTNILETSGFQSGDLQEGLNAISDASERAGNVIRRLRDMTRNHKPHSDTFQLGDALLGAVQLVRAGGCDGVGIACEIHVPGWVNADRIEIGQVIVNLLKNACEASLDAGTGRTVIGTISGERDQVRLSIHDEGPGVSARSLEHLFEWADSSKPDGMGIGLSISRTILEQYNGLISLDKSDENGSQFSLWLPKSPAAINGV